jgi:hypothetical protein
MADPTRVCKEEAPAEQEQEQEQEE